MDTKNIDTEKINNSVQGSKKPSQVVDEDWVVALVKEQIIHKRKFNTNKVGKWLAFIDIKEIDETWEKVKKATEIGILGLYAKVSTAKPNPNASSENDKVICIYTYNWQDVDDVYRVEKTLRSIGIEVTLYYKTNQDTRDGNYKVRGATNISKYISKANQNFDNFTLHSLSGIGDEKISILKNIGIKNFDDLLAFDTSKKLKNVGISTKYINNLKLYALSKIENKIYKLRPVFIPDGEKIYFDIETDISLAHNSKKIWSICVYYNNKIENFYASTWDEENKILKDFLNFIKKIENPNMFSYSGVGFDKSVLTFALKRHDLDADYFINCNHFDLCTLLRQNYIIPSKSYRLKDVGKFLGYEFKNDYFDGLYVAMKYIQCQKTGEELPKEIFDYIDDDVKSMHHIINTIQAGAGIKDLFDNSIEE